MNETAALAPVLPSTSSALVPMRMQDLLAQVGLIQEVMKSVMKEGEHYGKVPGCGDKPALFKAGAEKLCFVFRLAPKFMIEERTFENGHREYRVKCTLTTIGTNTFVGEGEGIASTMEGKYRFRTGPKNFTGKPVPMMYWSYRDSDPVAAKKLIGGPGFAVAKNEAGAWEIVEQGGRIDHDNPADYYNTVLKMAQKRAHVAVSLTATAASDIFAQDLEDIGELQREYDADVVATPVTGKASAGTAAANSGTSAANSGTGAAPANSGGQTASNPPASNAAWRKFIVPKFVKKYAGEPLGTMEEKDLAWWGQNYAPKPFGRATAPSPDDLAFRKALDEAMAEMRSHAGETAQKITERLDHQGEQQTAGAGEKPKEDVPY